MHPASVCLFMFCLCVALWELGVGGKSPAESVSSCLLLVLCVYLVSAHRLLAPGRKQPGAIPEAIDTCVCVCVQCVHT